MQNTLQQQVTTPLNKGFLLAAEAFFEKKWKMIENSEGKITFAHESNLCDEFKLRVSESIIEAVIPMPNSNIAYCTKFQNYFDASEYLIERFNDYLESTNITTNSVTE